MSMGRNKLRRGASAETTERTGEKKIWGIIQYKNQDSYSLFVQEEVIIHGNKRKSGAV
jgi:hypothetical protein